MFFSLVAVSGMFDMRDVVRNPVHGKIFFFLELSHMLSMTITAKEIYSAFGHRGVYRALRQFAYHEYMSVTTSFLMTVQGHMQARLGVSCQPFLRHWLELYPFDFSLSDSIHYSVQVLLFRFIEHYDDRVPTMQLRNHMLESMDDAFAPCLRPVFGQSCAFHRLTRKYVMSKRNIAASMLNFWQTIWKFAVASEELRGIGTVLAMPHSNLSDVGRNLVTRAGLAYAVTEPLVHSDENSEYDSNAITEVATDVSQSETACLQYLDSEELVELDVHDFQDGHHAVVVCALVGTNMI